MLSLLRRTGLTPRQLDYALKTEGAARSLLGLLNDILDFSKIEAGKMALDPQPFEFGTLLRDLSVILAANVGDRKLALLFDIDPALPCWLRGDAMRLQQVLVNLGGNAVKFTAEGEIVLSVQVLEQGEQAVRLRVAVRDTGIGIAPEHRERIFSGFTQAEPSTTRRFGGTGLGLAISQRLVGLMGGELRLDSTLGQGSCFHFDITLPVAVVAGDEPPAVATPRPLHARVEGHAGRRLAGLQLLVAEDNPNNQQIVRELLEDEGAQVRIAADGQEAVAAVAAATTPFDAVLMDLQMPVLDGLAATRQIRQRLDQRALPIVAMTANAMPADREACLAAGMSEHVGKPFELDALVGLLRRLTGRPAETAAPTDAAGGAGRDRPPGASPMPATLADRAIAAGVDLERALARLGGKRHLYERMLRGFVDELADLPAQLRAQLAAGDTETAARTLHTLKGLAGTLGASALSAAADQGRRALAAAATPITPLAAVLPVTAAIEAAGPRLLWLLQALQAEQATLAASAGGVGIDPVTEAAALQELAALLENSDMRANEVMAQLLHQRGSGMGAPWRALDDAIASLDFERALELCRSLLTEAVA